MVTCPIRATDMTARHWAFYANLTTGVGGAGTVEMLWSEMRAFLSPYGNEIIIDGVTMSITIAAGSNWRANVVSHSDNPVYAGITHTLGSGTAAATVNTQESWFPLAIQTSPGTGIFFQVIATFAQNDQIVLSAWGRFIPPEKEQEVIPVNVQEFHFLQPKKKVGPV